VSIFGSVSVPPGHSSGKEEKNKTSDEHERKIFLIHAQLQVLYGGGVRDQLFRVLQFIQYRVLFSLTFAEVTSS